MNRFYRFGFASLALALAILLLPAAGNNAFAQVSKGSISGTVTDPQSLAVAGAQVKATQVGTGAVFTTTSDSSGTFRLNLLPVGTYKLEITAQGFKTRLQPGIEVNAGEDRGLSSVKLEIGAVGETIEVSAAPPLIETSQAQVTSTFSGTTLETFAGIQENQGLDNLALFVPGVASVRDNAFSNSNGGVGFSVNGLRGRNNDQQIEGQNNNDNSVAGPGLFLSDAEWVGQYVIVTNNFGAEYGRNSGSVVNIIPKSGSNTWHGAIYGTENNSILNSLSNFQKDPRICAPNCLTKPPRLNDEFGGFDVGGPWVRDKLFFFGGFDEEIVSQKAQFNSNAITPTPAGLAALAACATTPAQQAAVAAVTKFGPYGITAGNPVINGTPVTGKVTACPGAEFAGVSRTVPQPVHIFNWIAKTDLQLSHDTVVVRYLFNRDNFFNLGDNGAAGYFFNVPALSQAAVLSWSHIFSSRMSNELRGSFGRLNVEFGGGNLTGAPEPVAGQLDQALANITFNSAATNLPFGPATNLPQQRIVNTWQAQDNWSYVMGKHQLKAGVNWTYQRSPNIFLPNINGAYRFGSWNSFFNNTPNRIRVALGPEQLDFREYDTFVYGGDDYKLTPHVTLNLGLTWSYYGQPANLFNSITTARESNAATAFWASTEPVGTPANCVPAVPGRSCDGLNNAFTNPGAAIPLSARTDPTIPAPKNSFGPSIGFAYSPQWGGFLTGHGKTTLRGGYRLSYDPPFYNIYLNVSTSAPEVFLQSIPSASTHPLPAAPFGPAVRASLASSLTKGAFDPREFSQTHVTPNFGPDKVHSWSLGIQREVTKNSVVEARYVGNAARGQFQTLDGNPKIDDLKRDFPSLVPAGLTPCPASSALWTNGRAPFGGNDPVGRLDCNAAVSRIRVNSGFSNYNGVQLEFRANNMFNQLTMKTTFTYSKTMDNVSEIFSTFGGGNSVFFAQNPANQVKGPGEYSFSGLDYPHLWSLTFYEQLPFFKDQHGVFGHILGGWGLSANYIIASGQRYTPIQIFEANATANGDYYDFGYIAGFAGVDTARPFLGNLSAPSTAVGIFAGDACALFEPTAGGACDPTLAPTTLLSQTAMGPNCVSGATDALGNPLPCAVVPVTKNQVRFITNAGTAQSIFGTPFGDTPRNPVQDAITNIANFSVVKRIKFNERSSFEFHTTFLNVFNHSNFSSIDPFTTDAGVIGAFSGFGDPSLTPNVNTGAPPTRRIIFGGKVTF